MEVARRTVQPYEGEQRASNEDFDEDWLRQFLACGVQIKNKKTPITERSVCCVCVLFSTTKSMLRTRMGSCVYFCCHNILSFPQSAAKVPMVSVLEFHCCRVIPLANHKLTFDERIGCITRQDGFRREVIRQFHWKLLFSSETAKPEAIVVEAPFKRKTIEVIVIWYKLISNMDFIRERPL